MVAFRTDLSSLKIVRRMVGFCFLALFGTPVARIGIVIVV